MPHRKDLVDKKRVILYSYYMVLFRKIDLPFVKKLFIAGVLLSALSIYFMGVAGSPLDKQAILALEFVLTEENAGTIMQGWGETERSAAVTQTYIDFIFIFAYTVSLTTLWLYIIHAFLERPWSGFIQFTGAILILASILAGLYDVIENLFLLDILRGGGHPAPIITTVFAAFKWLLVLPSLVLGALLGAFALILSGR